MYYKSTHVLECNVVSNFKHLAKNFRRFKILGAPGGPEGHSFCIFFNIIKRLLYLNGNLSQNLKAIDKDLLDF